MSKTLEPNTFTGRLERGMREAGYNPRSLSLAAGLGMTAVRDILDGRIGSPRYATIEALAKVLGVTVAFLAIGEPDLAEAAAIEARDFPVYGAALSGPNGAIIRSSEPIQRIARPDSLLTVISSYGVFVVGELMSPAYEQGDIALVHPSLPPRRGADVILLQHGSDGTEHLLISHLVDWSDTEWHVRQHHPRKELKLPRGEWTEIQTIVGRYNAR